MAAILPIPISAMRFIAGRERDVSIAAINAPGSTVISGRRRDSPGGARCAAGGRRPIHGRRRLARVPLAADGSRSSTSSSASAPPSARSTADAAGLERDGSGRDARDLAAGVLAQARARGRAVCRRHARDSPHSVPAYVWRSVPTRRSCPSCRTRSTARLRRWCHRCARPRTTVSSSTWRWGRCSWPVRRSTGARSGRGRVAGSSICRPTPSSANGAGLPRDDSGTAGPRDRASAARRSAPHPLRDVVQFEAEVQADAVP